MLMYMLFLLFMMPLCLFKNLWWLVHCLMFLLSFIYLINYHDYIDYNSVSYGLAFDPISFMMILLSLWLSTLMFTSSASIYLTRFY